MESTAVDSPYAALLNAAISIPISHYFLIFVTITIIILYDFLELHFLQDLFTGFRGQRVTLTFNPSSHVYHDVVSKCRSLHGRYLSTPWICSPNLQLLFLQFFGNPPVVEYRRQIFMTSDGGTLALDWVVNTEVKKPDFQGNDTMKQDDRNPIVVIVPGLTSDSKSSYIRHLASKMATRGRNVVVSNHRGLGGVAITSDCFYHGGWTEDVRRVIEHIHCQNPEAPLYVVGTSIGANILIKYLSEEGINSPIAGAASICCPWDLLICDRFLNRGTRQWVYNKALTIGLKIYAKSHEAVLSRILDWEGIKKARILRDFDDCATRVVGKYESVDTYYRRCSSANFVGSVMVPLLCISSIDDPVCTSEAIPYDECRLNPNVVLATTQHGGHLPFFEGFTAKSVWWVRAVDEFFCVLQSSPMSHWKKEMPVSTINPVESSIDQAPYVQALEDGTVIAVNEEVTEIGNMDQNKTENSVCTDERQNDENNLDQTLIIVPSKEQDIRSDIVTPVKKNLNQLSRQNRKSLWLLAYIAMVTTWPVVGSILAVVFRKKLKNLFSRR